MYKEGNIIYFTPFYFKNGNPAKSKYFVVLKNVDGKAVLASLPTRKDSVPEKDTVDSGCVELPEINLNCFVIDTNTVITNCGKKFQQKTHIYGHEIDTHDLPLLNEQYQIEGSDYDIFGQMKQDFFEELLKCLKNSKSVKKKHQRILA